MINQIVTLLVAALRRPGCAALAVCALLGAAPAGAADPAKVLRLAFAVAETAFDPVAVSDLYSGTVLEAIVEPMLAYDYLARPARLVPSTLTAMPEVNGDGSEYVFRVRPGIRFTPDTAFGGKPRELTAADYAFSIRRLFDPRLKSPWLFLLEGKIVGLDGLMQQARDRNAPFDYDAPVPGLEVVDRYTLRIRLTQPDFNLLYILAMPTLGALAREVVERYGNDIGSHPVGTGPYLLREWVRSHRMVLEANPDYRAVTYTPAAPPADAEDAAIARRLAGRTLPLIGRVEVNIIEEAQPRYLAFLNGDLDLVGVPNEFADLAIPGGRLAANLAARGVRLSRTPEPDTTYTYFNMDDKVVGGYTREKIALRRAISLAYDTRAEIAILRKNQAIAAQTPIPPGVAGYDPALRSSLTEYNPARAKALLDLVGYRDVNGDGYREQPDGSPLAIEYASTTSILDRQFDELWKRCMDEIGIRITFRKAKWPELLKASKLGQLQMKGAAWTADYPDGDNFLQLLYGPNAGQANDARFRLPAFDRLYEQAKRLPDGPERNALYRRMSAYVLAYAPWRLGVHRLGSTLVQPWVAGYREHPIIHAPWKYMDVEAHGRPAR